MVKYFCDRCGRETPGQGWPRLSKEVCDRCKEKLDKALEDVRTKWEQTKD